VAEWLGWALQKLLLRFESARCLYNLQSNLEVFFMFNFFQKLDKEMVRIHTILLQPSKQFGGFFYV
jgi:hypothetical protein